MLSRCVFYYHIRICNIQNLMNSYKVKKSICCHSGEGRNPVISACRFETLSEYPVAEWGETVLIQQLDIFISFTAIPGRHVPQVFGWPQSRARSGLGT